MKIRSIPRFFAFFALALASIANSNGQSRPLPNANYYQPFFDFYQGDYRSAGKDFSSGANSAYKVGTQRYLDSICFWTMVGECHYHLGNYAEAIQMYEQSLDLYLGYQSQQWQSRLKMPPAIQVDNSVAQRARITWGTPGRNATIPRMPDSFEVLFGRLDAERAFQQGGVVQNAEFRQIDLNEIMRCTALALHRRRVIKGPTSKYDVFSAKLVAGLRGAPTGDGTLIGAYNGVLLGIAEASMDDWESAAKTLKRSLQFNGNMDHPLTPVALLELANIGLETDSGPVAGQLALEASFSAASFFQYDLIEESLSLGAKIHLLTNKSPYPPLEPAVIWANREKARLMQASLMVRLAECYAESNQPDLAATVLSNMNAVINSRNSLSKAVVSSRLKFVSAVIDFEKGNFVNGLNGLNSALASFQTGSLWLYRLGLADNLAAAGNIGERQADLLYGALLRDPSDQDWRLDPLEAISFLASNHVVPMERWFDIVVSRKDMERAVNIAELVRRHRFYSQLPLGGRLMAFRWVMHAPEEALSDNARQQRRKFLAQNSQYLQWSDRIEQIRTALLLLPLKPEDRSDEAHEQTKLMAEMGDISNLQESVLASYSLRREPAEMVFPPQFDLSDFRDNMAKDELALVSLATNSGYHMFFVNSISVQYLGLGRARDVQKGVTKLLKALGILDASVDFDTLQATEWKTEALELTKKLLGDIPADAWKEVRELTIVPDGLLWYLPFEVLQIGEGDEQKNLAEIVELRYSPTLFLAYRAQRPQRPLERTAVVTGKMHARGEMDLSDRSFNKLLADVPSAIHLEKPIRLPSNLLGSLLDELIIWSEILPPRNGGALDMQPMQFDLGRIGTSLGAWLTLPWPGPEHVIMPGFQSDGGAGMRGKLDGTDLFLTTTGLMGAGTRTILISRWRTGGANSLALSRGYAERLPKMRGGQALSESVAESRKLDLDYANEPQVRTKSRDAILKAEHPYFWAGMMRMEIPTDKQPAIEKPLVDEVKPDLLPGEGEKKVDPADKRPDDAENNGDKIQVPDVGEEKKDGEVKEGDNG